MGTFAWHKVNKMESKGPLRDYLKYWRVIRILAKKKWQITESDLDMLLFLYSESLFDRSLFNDYEKVFSWDTRRLKRMIDNGWIMVDDRFSRVRSKKLYRLTNKANLMIKKIYAYLDGSEPIPTDVKKNPLFKKKKGYMERRLAREMLNINAQLKRGSLDYDDLP